MAFPRQLALFRPRLVFYRHDRPCRIEPGQVAVVARLCSRAMSAFLRKPAQHQERISLPLVTQGYLLAAPVGHYDWLVPDPLKGEIMIEILPESGGNLLAVMAHGEVTRDDYTEVLIPRLDEIIHQYGKARLLYAFADDFTGFTLGHMG